MKLLNVVRAGLAVSAFVAAGSAAHSHFGSRSATMSHSQVETAFHLAAASARPDQADEVHGYPC